MAPGTRIAVDIGGSGARVAEITPIGQVADIRRARIGSRSELMAEMDRYGRISWLGLSVPGVVRINDGDVMRSGVTPWLVGSLRQELARELECSVEVVNDGSAHALGMTAIPDLELGAICLALGTSVGFGALTESGELVQTLSGTSFEVGDMRLHTSASIKEAWWAVGQPGLEELEQAHGSAAGRERFAYRVGAFAKTLTIALQPRSVCFSGGFVARYWHVLESPIRAELSGSLSWGHTPRVFASTSVEPALDGLARLAPPLTA